MRIQGVLGIFLFLGACSATSTSGDSGERGPIGKADLVGSCADACGGPAIEGNCFCDDVCAIIGDCCSDKVTLCGGDGPTQQACGGFAGLQCADGEICVDDTSDDCDPNRGGADCPGVCETADVDDPKECLLSCVIECETTLGCDLSCGNCFDKCAAQCGVEPEEPAFCTTDADCSEDEFCSDTPCVPSCPVCQDCNAVCQPKPSDESCEVSLDCEDGGYCHYPDGVCGDAAGQCEVVPDLCIEIFAPVCGCDGKTYSNFCFAAGAGVSIDHDGACAPEAGCCDADSMPQCIEGASCCADGSWTCNDGAGQSTCADEGKVCNSLCLGDDDCGGGQTCDESVCHNPPCPRGNVCPAVCFGECTG